MSGNKAKERIGVKRTMPRFHRRQVETLVRMILEQADSHDQLEAAWTLVAELVGRMPKEALERYAREADAACWTLMGDEEKENGFVVAVVALLLQHLQNKDDELEERPYVN